MSPDPRWSRADSDALRPDVSGVPRARSVCDPLRRGPVGGRGESPEPFPRPALPIGGSRGVAVEDMRPERPAGCPESGWQRVDNERVRGVFPGLAGTHAGTFHASRGVVDIDLSNNPRGDSAAWSAAKWRY